MGIEPASLPWQGSVVPINYYRWRTVPELNWFLHFGRVSVRQLPNNPLRDRRDLNSQPSP